MPRPSSHSTSEAENSCHSEISQTQETLFLLSISRDEDDAAALRADLKRSTLGNYKIQHCANLDDALHLMRVCGFDLVFIRLDDFQDKQAAIDIIKGVENEQTIIALATGRLLSNPAFILPEKIDAICRIEDISPSLISTLVVSTLERKRNEKRRIRLEQELHLALDAGQLGSWSLEIESGRLELDANASLILDFPAKNHMLLLDDALEHVYPDDRSSLKRSIAKAIDEGEGLKVSFRLNGASMPLPKVELAGEHSESGPRDAQHLFGIVKRANPATEIYERIANANAAIQRALDERHQAIHATQELRGPDHDSNDNSLEEPEVAPQTAPQKREPAFESKTASNLKEEPKLTISTREQSLNTPPPVPIKPRQDEPKQTEAPEPSLSINKQEAFQNVLKSLAKQQERKEPGLQDTFPFDFSTESEVDYTEPDPNSEGFIGAAKRLVSITKKAHKLNVSLSLEQDSTIEAECEKDLIFEILRELLTNVVKHARATECIIAIFRDEDEWVLQVEDDGVGLENNLVSISTPLNQIGLFRIRTKLALKGGQLDLTPSSPRGLVARARLPINLIRPGNHPQDAEHS